MISPVIFDYRLAYFLPNPTVLWRIPFAVFVEYGGACFVGIAKLLPDAAYLGSATRAALLRLGIEEIQRDPWGHRGHLLAQRLGPHFEIGGVERLSTRSFEVVPWAVDNLLPH